MELIAQVSTPVEAPMAMVMRIQYPLQTLVTAILVVRRLC